MAQPQYRQMANLYDWPDALEFSAVMLRRTRTAFRQHGLQPPARVCDLGCGTGTLALALAEAGFAVMGVDLSADMLKLARAKTRDSGLPVRWLREDMRHFSVPEPVDAVTCYYDAINHLLTERDLLAALRRVYRALRPGGLFCFDANTLFCFHEFWEDLVHMMEHDGATQITAGTFNRRTGRASATVTGFVPVGRTRYRKFVEQVDERYYSADTWRRLLRQAEFTRVRLREFDPWDHGGPRRMKWFVTATKPARA